MNPEVTQQAVEVQRLLDYALRLPMALVWCGIVTVLAIVTLRCGRHLIARRVAVINSVVCLVMTAGYVGLVTVRPKWFAEWMGDVAWIVLGLGFIVGLNAMIFSCTTFKTDKEGWRQFGIALCIGAFVIVHLMVNAEIPLWLAGAAVAVIGAAVGAGCLIYLRTEGRIGLPAA